MWIKFPSAYVLKFWGYDPNLSSPDLCLQRFLLLAIGNKPLSLLLQTLNKFFVIAGFCLVFVLFFDVLCFFPFFFLLLGEIKDLRQWITTSFISWENLRIILFCRIVHLIFTWDNWIKSISQWILVVPTTHVSYRIINNRRVNVEQGLLRFFSNYSFFFYTLKFRH